MIDKCRPARDGARERGLRRAVQAVAGACALAFPVPLTLPQFPALSLRSPFGAVVSETVQTGRQSGNSYAQDVVELINQRRAAYGCPQLAVNPALTSAAYQHSKDMAVNDYFGHDTPSGVTPWTRMRIAGYADPAAENIAEGYRTPQEVVAGWMNSPGHRRNILNCSYRASGVGYYDGTPESSSANDAQNNTDANSAGPWWTQDFGFK